MIGVGVVKPRALTTESTKSTEENTEGGQTTNFADVLIEM
jgi:hypothetical protein